MYNLVDVLRLLGNCVVPVMPNRAMELLSQLGLDLDAGASWKELTSTGAYPAGTGLSLGEVLFPRFDESALESD